MRTSRVVIVVLVLIGFPLISWLYLSKGLKWRINAQQETEVKGRLGGFALQTDHGDMVNDDGLRGRYSVFALGDMFPEMESLHKIDAQFSVRPDYQTIVLNPTSADTAFMNVECVQGCEALLNALFAGKFSAAIVDSALQVRGRYDLSDAEDVKNLVKHLAVVLPITKRETLELKRDGGKQ